MGFDLRSGQIQITIPEVYTQSDYSITRKCPTVVHSKKLTLYL